MSQVSKEAKKVFSKNATMSITIGLFAGLVVTAVTLLNFLSFLLGFIGFCFISLPLIFGCHLAFAALALGMDVKFSALFYYFRQYYSFSFNGVFRVVKSALKALAVFVGALFTCGIISSAILLKINPDGFSEVINAFYDYSFLGSDTYTINDLFAMNGGLLSIFMLSTLIPTYLSSSIFFVYKLSLKSLNVYFRMNVPKFNPMIVRAIEDHFYSLNKWKIKKDFFKNNWFIPLLMLAFAAGGIVLGINVLTDPTQVANISISFMALSSIVFFPIYFYIMHGIYSKYEIDYKKSSLEISKRIYERVKFDYEAMGKEMEQEKEEFEKVINSLEEESKEDNDENSSQE